MRHRIPFLAAAVATLLAMNAGSALANIPGTPDAEQTGFSGSLIVEPMLAQTFVPTISGPLVYVAVYTSYAPIPTVAAGPNTVPDITVAITGTDGSGFPTSPLASETLAPGDSDWVGIDFTVPANVVALTKYAIVVTQDGTTGQALWNGSCLGDPYGPGKALIFDGTWQTVGSFFPKTCLSDFAFQTRITAAAATPVQSFLGQTPPPTTTGSPSSGESPSYLLILAGLASGAAAAAVFASISRRRLIRR